MGNQPGSEASQDPHRPVPPYSDLCDLHCAPRTDETTPKDVLLQQLSHCPPNRTPIVLYTCGSMCPIHKQHVRLQELAKEYLEQNHNCHVLGGFIATSNDVYVRSKYEHSGRSRCFLNWEDRAELIELALDDHPFIRFDRWDREDQPVFQEYYAAHASLACHIDSWATSMKFPTKVHVLAVHGADLVEKCNIFSFFPRFGLGCVGTERPGYSLPEEKPEQCCFVCCLPKEELDGSVEDISSTAVQQLLKADQKHREKAAKMLHPKVLDWLVARWCA